MDPKMYPQARQSIGSDDIETTPTLADLLELFDAANTNERKAISLLTLMTNMLIRFAVTTLTATESPGHASGASSSDPASHATAAHPNRRGSRCLVQPFCRREEGRGYETGRLRHQHFVV